MADRSIVLRIKADIGDLSAKAKTASKSLKDIGEGGKKEVGKLTKSLRDNRSEWDHLSNTSATAGALLAAGVGAAIKTYADFDEQMSAVAATGEDARNNLDALRDTAIKLGADTQYSADEAAAGIEELLKAGVSAEDAIGGGLAGALDLAAAGQIQVADAAEIAATAMVQFKLSGEDVPHIADLLAAAAGKAQGGVSDMAQALQQSGLVASQMGLSVEETTGSLAAFASSGLIGSDAGTSFRNMLLRLANPTDKAADLMAELGIQAYDANGNFVGMADIAGQLQGALGGLDQSQRDAALATLFGNDAIRAANVLYEQGSEGIQQWISDVDDAGYASETAATKTDNLAGDFERLTGAIDTLLIKSGSGGNDFLRGIVQGAEGAIEAFTQLDEDALNLATGIGGVTAASLLTFAALGKVATTTAETIEAMKVLRKQAPLAARGLGLVRSAASLAVGALAGLSLVSLDNYLSGSDKTINDYTKAIQNLSEQGTTLEEFNSQIAEAFGGERLSHGSEQIKSVSDAILELRNIGQVDQLGIGKAFDWLPGVQSRSEKITEEIKKIDAALAGEGIEKAGPAFAKLAEEMKHAGLFSHQIAEYFPQLKKQAEELAESVNYEIKTPEELVNIMGGQLPPAMKKALEATDEGRKALDEYEKSAQEAAGATEEVTKSLEELAELALAAESAEIAFEAAIDNATESVKENGRTLDNNTEKGRANNTALINLAQSSTDLRKKLEEQGATTEELSKHNERAYDEFIEVAKSMGATQEEAEQLAVKYGLIPPKVTTHMSAPGIKNTQKQVDFFNETIRRIPPEKRAELQSVFNNEGYEAYRKAWSKVTGKTVDIRTNYITTYSSYNKTPGMPGSGPNVFSPYADGGEVQYLADGGFSSPGNGSLKVTGGRVAGSSPHAKADNIPTMLTAREFVHPVASHDYYGTAVMEGLRTRSIPKSLFAAAGYADGGSVGQQPVRLPGSVSRTIARNETVQYNSFNIPNLNPYAAMAAAGKHLEGVS